MAGAPRRPETAFFRVLVDFSRRHRNKCCVALRTDSLLPYAQHRLLALAGNGLRILC